MVSKTLVPDPIHGTIEMPKWLVNISKEKAVRRMMFIRQLGLKAYVDFPGAIHTRYSHLLGVMHLSGKIVDMLQLREQSLGRNDTAQNLKDNKNTIMAAGFLHDIGHGPFSHVLDYVLKKSINKDHEDIASDIIDKLPDIEDHGITKSKVKSIIKGKHTFPFISQIINGPLDADKLDYLLRDAHHVGLKYSLDLEHFINHYNILGSDSSKLDKCELGLSNEYEAIVTAEIFIIIWKSMYDLVYHVENSRMAEKMLEKAIFLRIKDDDEFKKKFTNIESFIELNDEKLFEDLKEKNGLTKELVTRISDNKLYHNIYDDVINATTFPGLLHNEKFLEELDTNPEELSEKLTVKLNEELKLDSYQLICDIIKSRQPKTINIDWGKNPNNEPAELNNVSEIVAAVKGRNRIKVYATNLEVKSKSENLITNQISSFIDDWS